jgi:hypothetical protein
LLDDYGHIRMKRNSNDSLWAGRVQSSCCYLLPSASA